VPPCRVDSTSSARYTKLLSKLNDGYLADDLQALCRDIEADYSAAGWCVPRLKLPLIAGKIWMFRTEDRARGQGKSYGYRVIGYLEDGVMYLIAIFSKKDRDDLSKDDYKKLVNALLGDLNAPEDC
jgi:hypothetical protein